MASQEQKTPSDLVGVFLTYPFAEDQAYQQGLASILSALDEKPDEEREQLLLQSRIYYFNRITGASITPDEIRSYQEPLSSRSEGPNGPALPAGSPTPDSISTYSNSTDSSEPPTLTFAQLKELIETGQTDRIPNNKLIPDALNEAPPSESKAPPRKKPWEQE